MPDKTYTNSIGMEFIMIHPGTFHMGWKYGGNDEVPSHEVTISKPFYLGKYPVTFAQWKAVMGSVRISRQMAKLKKYPNRFTEEYDNLPAIKISWDETKDYINALTGIENGDADYRLPTEAEWEYSCRAGNSRLYAEKREAFDPVAWYKNNSRNIPHSVGLHRPNSWGLYDMVGNVWEWVEDRYDDEYYAVSPKVDPTGPTSGSFHVLRGASYRSTRKQCRYSYRTKALPSSRGDEYGFRLIAVLEK